MAFDVIGTISQGFSRTTARNGLLFIGLFVVVGVGRAVLFPGLSSEGTGMDPIITLPLGVAVVLYAVFLLANMALHIGAIRTFVTPETEELSREVFTRNLLPVILHLLIATLFFVIAVGIGLVLLIIPGLFLLTALFFYHVFIIVEDDSSLRGLQNSWSLTAGHRLRLFALGFVVIGLTVVLSGLFAFLGQAVGAFASVILVEVAVAIGAVFVAATTAQAYLHLQSIDAVVEVSHEDDDELDGRGRAA